MMFMQVLSFFLTLQIVLAQSPNDLVEKLNEVQRRVKSPGADTNCCGQNIVFGVPGKNLELVESAAYLCIKSICGSEEKSQSYIYKYVKKLWQLSDEQRENKNRIQLPQDNKDTMEQIAKLQSDYDKKNLEYLKKAVAQKDFKISEKFKALANFVTFSRSAGAVAYKSVSENGESQIVVDEEKTRANLSFSSPRDQDYVIEISKYMRSLSIGMSRKEIETLPPLVLLKKNFPNEIETKVLDQMIEKIKNQLGDSNNANPIIKMYLSSVTNEVDLAEIKSKIDSHQANEDEMRNILSLNYDLATTFQLLSNSKGNPLAKRMPLSGEGIMLLSGGRKELVDHFDGVIKDHEDRQKDYISACDQHYLTNSVFLPDDSQVTALRKLVEDAKKQVATHILPLYSLKTQLMLAKVISSLTFTLPPSVREYKKALESHLASMLAAERNILKNNTELSEQDNLSFAMILAFQSKLGATHTTSFESNDNKFCGRYIYSPISDEILPQYGTAFLSFSTATGPTGPALDTIIHEIGHALTDKLTPENASVISLKKYRETRACFASMHNDDLPSRNLKVVMNLKGGGKPSDGSYVNEDYADAIGALADKEMVNSNPWCQFLNVKGLELKYSDESFIGSEKDVHSSNLFRLFHFENLRKRPLTNECRNFFKKASGAPSFQNCLEKFKVTE